MESETKLTSVNILTDVYINFKKSAVQDSISLQKIVNRALDLYAKNQEFRDTIINHSELINKKF